jgi:hypothetical protein
VHPWQFFEPISTVHLTQVNNPNPDIQWEQTAQYGIGLDYEMFDGRFGGAIDLYRKETENLIFRQDFAQPAAVDFQWVNLDGTVVNQGIGIFYLRFSSEYPQTSPGESTIT